MPDKVADVSKLRVVEKGSELFRSGSFNAFFGFLLHSRVSGIRRNAVEDVLNSALHVVEGSSKGGLALISRETHRHQFLDLGLVVLGWRLRLCRLRSFLLLFRFRNFLLLCFHFDWLGLYLFLGLRLWLLHQTSVTWT